MATENIMDTTTLLLCITPLTLFSLLLLAPNTVGLRANDLRAVFTLTPKKMFFGCVSVLGSLFLYFMLANMLAVYYFKSTLVYGEWFNDEVFLSALILLIAGAAGVKGLSSVKSFTGDIHEGILKIVRHFTIEQFDRLFIDMQKIRAKM